MLAARHPNDETEAARPDTRDRVLYHDGPIRGRPETPGGLLEGVRGRLAGKLLSLCNIPIHSSIEEIPQAGRFQHRVQFLLDVTTAVRSPLSPSSRTRATEDAKICTPLVLSTSLNAAFLRFPIPHTVSLSGGSPGSPHSRTMPRERKKLSTPS